ncbi:protein trachealess [Frankliniella occidentalis]|uniref:Protein trachealess n=1 Tax=Frankliniella occidentalis TaxID=133901 RepID=A0A9C6TY01_FRAOC|nr:protein trachealess [Frankliniella occidentalis]
MSQLGTVYATKRRRRNGKSLKPPPKDGVTKSNPSKRHRERLNAELDTLANLLPFEQNILSKLDRLSILRLSVSYLRTKSYFQVTMHKDKEDPHYRSRGELTAYDHTPLDGDMFLQFQSDIVHQSVYELVHSEDREELQRQLLWNSFLPPESSGVSLTEALQPDNSHLLERSFTVRFRCLLDNTSGFLRLDIRGRVKVLHGQNRKTEEPPLALFALCTPFGPPSLLEVPQKEVMFKSKHKLDLTLVSMDQRGKLLLGYSDSELANMGGYDMVHYDDLAYVASAHQELLKTGASGMIAYRVQSKDGNWQWLQTSSRLVYKNSKPDFVISTHRPLMEEEGRDLLGKRTMDFKVSYLDAGLTSSYFTDSEQLVGLSPVGSSGSPASSSSTTPTQRVSRRYKTQLRDFLSTCRTKRKLNASAASGGGATPGQVTPTVDYVDSTAAAVAAAAAYSNLNPLYSTAYPTTGAADNGLSYMGHSNYQPLYDNHNLFQYRTLGPYYPTVSDYHSSSYVANGFPVGCGLSAYGDHPQLPPPRVPSVGAPGSDCDKLYAPEHHDVRLASAAAYPSKCLDLDPTRTSYDSSRLYATVVQDQQQSVGKKVVVKESHSTGASPSPGPSPSHVNGVTPKMEASAGDLKPDVAGSPYRQTVLMWGSAPAPASPSPHSSSPGGPGGVAPTPNGGASAPGNPLKSLAEMNVVAHAVPSPPQPPLTPSSPLALKAYQYGGYGAGDGAGVVGAGVVGAGEVWQHHAQYYHPYHNPHPPPGDSSAYPQISRPGVLCCPSLR